MAGTAKRSTRTTASAPAKPAVKRASRPQDARSAQGANRGTSSAKMAHAGDKRDFRPARRNASVGTTQTGMGKTEQVRGREYLRVDWVEITRYDWPHGQFVCYRLWPILRPQSFRRVIRAEVSNG